MIFTITNRKKRGRSHITSGQILRRLSKNADRPPSPNNQCSRCRQTCSEHAIVSSQSACKTCREFTEVVHLPKFAGRVVIRKFMTFLRRKTWDIYSYVLGEAERNIYRRGTLQSYPDDRERNKEKAIDFYSVSPQDLIAFSWEEGCFALHWGSCHALAKAYVCGSELRLAQHFRTRCSEASWPILSQLFNSIDTRKRTKHSVMRLK